MTGGTSQGGVSAELLALIDEDYRHSWQIIDGMTEGGEVFDQGAITIACSSLPIAWINIAFIRAPLDRPAEQIAAAASFFSQRKLPFVFRIREGVDAAAEQACIEQGYPFTDNVPSLIMAPIEQSDAASPLEIRVCRDADDLAAFRDVMAACFGFTDEQATSFFSSGVPDTPGCELYIGRKDGQAVACSSLMVTGRLAGVQIVGCLPDERRKGFGEAMTWKALERGRELGCDIAGLQASDMGRPIYERMGFRFVTNFKTFTRD